MISVICLQWGDKYDDEYVRILHDSVGRNLTVPHEFICFTERYRPIDCSMAVHPFHHARWWNKLELFEIDTKFCAHDRILFIDLDVVITKNFDNLASMSGKFLTADNWWAPGAVNSCIMLWQKGAQKYLHDKYIDIGAKWMSGDQDFIQKHAVAHSFFEEFAPDDIVSYKQHCENQGLPDTAKMVFFHGDPKPHEVGDPWVKEHWRCQNVTT